MKEHAGTNNQLPCRVLGFSNTKKDPFFSLIIVILLILFSFSFCLFYTPISSHSIHVITHRHMLFRLISPKILSIPHHANLGSFVLLTEEKKH